MYVDFRKHRKFAQRLAASVVSVLLMLINIPVLMSFFGAEGRFVLLPSSVCKLLFNYFYVAQFACACLTVRERFHLLNEYLAGFESFDGFLIKDLKM